MDIGLAAVGGWAFVVAIVDGWRQRVPNALLLLMLVPAVLAITFRGQGLLGAGAVSSVVGFLVGGLVLLPGYLSGKMGAGDVKLAAVLGLLSGFSAVLFWLLYAALVLGLMAAVAALLRYRFKTQWKKIPAAVALITGFLAYLCWGRMGIALG